ncbi:MAG: YdcF family protein [Alphaproteobacteria bacterium]
MWSIEAIVKPLLLPPMSLFLIGAVGLALRRRHPRSGRALIGLAAGALYLLGTPLVANTLLRTLETAPPLTDPRAINDVGAIVVASAGVEARAPEYGGDTADALTLARIRYGAKLHRETGLPILVSGGVVRRGQTPVARVMQRVLTEDFGTPAAWVEDASRNTYENAKFSAAILRPAGIHRIFLVTHAWHMPRAMAAFEANGLEVVPAPTGFTPAVKWRLNSLLTGSESLRRSSYAVYEWVGRLWYRLAYGVTGAETASPPNTAS